VGVTATIWIWPVEGGPIPWAAAAMGRNAARMIHESNSKSRTCPNVMHAPSRLRGLI
jgi:hypothetical protein